MFASSQDSKKPLEWISRGKGLKVADQDSCSLREDKGYFYICNNKDKQLIAVIQKATNTSTINYIIENGLIVEVDAFGRKVSQDKKIKVSP